MLGLTLRVTAVMIGAMLLVVLITGGAFFLQRRADSESGARLPLPDRIAAIVQLLEQPPRADESLLLQALQTEDLALRIEPGPWLQQAEDEPDFPALELITRRYLGALGERRIDAGIGDGAARGRLGALFGSHSLRTGSPLHLRVELRDGRIAVLDLRGPLLRRGPGRPLLVGTALLILLTAVLSAASLKRQIRPLETLADAVERFGSQVDSAPLPQHSDVREVRRLVAAFDRMRERIRELLESRTRMIAAISHDFGTYLTRLRLRIEYIDDAGQRARAEQDLADMQQLLRDALALGRLDAAAEQTETLDLAELAQRQVARHADGSEPVRLTLPEAGLNVPVRGRPSALARVLDNLIGNALKYGGSADVSVRRDATHAELWVEDRGPGIPPEQRDLVLEPFYRIDTARTLDARGSGLGLAIVADIVRRLAGALFLEDRPGGGLRVRVRLPLAQA